MDILLIKKTYSLDNRDEAPSNAQNNSDWLKFFKGIYSGM